MACERVDITVLVVDDDDSTLAMVANILSSWEYKVLTAKNARDALEILRDFEGFFDLVITELHISGMNGFEFQKRIKEEFKLPVVMMSADSRKSVMSKSMENGAAYYILKPICSDDLKDIWKYAMAARKGKHIYQNELMSGKCSLSGEKINFQDLNSFVTSSVVGPKRRKKYSKRKRSQMNKEDQCEGSSRAPKKPKVVWTTYLHNLFLLAIKQIGLDKAVPKRILEIMDVPGLTRENVASHLQKYRIFLRKVAERGIIEGLSDRALRSRFASGLSASVIKDIQKRIAQLRVPVQQYLKRPELQTGNGWTTNAFKPSNQGPICLRDHEVSRNTCVPQFGSMQSNPLHTGLILQTGNGGTANALKPSNQGPIRLHDHEASRSTYVPQFGNGQSNPLHIGFVFHNQKAYDSDSLNQVRHGQSSFWSNGASNFQNPMFGSYENPICQAYHPYNANSTFPAYGIGHGLMTSANGLTGCLSYGDPMYQCGSLGNHSFSFHLGNGNQGYLGSSNLPWSSTSYPNNNYSGIKLNGGSQMARTGMNKGGLNSVGIPATISYVNSFGLINGTPNANMPMAPIGNENSALIQGRFASASGNGSTNELPLSLINNAARDKNISWIPSLSQQLDGLGNTANKHQGKANSMSEGEANQLENDLTELFLTLDDMHLLNETEENPYASEFLNSDLSSSSNVVQTLEQPQSTSDVIVPANESRINMPDETATKSEKNPNQDWDMELIEALFGVEPN